MAFLFGGASDLLAEMKRDKLSIETGKGLVVFDIEVAETDAEKALGLMFRKRLDPGKGMLFPYSEPDEISMWMRNTFVSLDMVFVGKDGRVHRVEERTEPMSEKIILSQGPVTAVLEIGAGEAERLGIKAGDLVVHPHFGTGKGE